MCEVEKLKQMESIIEKDQIVIIDLQIIYDKNGNPLIADPLDAYSGKYADKDGIDKTKRAISQNILMVEDILKKKK